MKAVPSNVRKGLEVRAGAARNKLTSLPTELKQYAVDAADGAASSLKQRVANSTSALFGASDDDDGDGDVAASSQGNATRAQSVGQ